MVTAHSLATILDPLGTETFFKEYWEKKPLVLHRGRPSAFADLLSVHELGHLLADRDMHNPAVSLVDHTRKLHAEDYTHPSGLIDTVKLHRYFADGATLIMQSLETETPRLHRLVRALEAETSTRFQANIYCTPGGAQGFNTHYDSHDVIVLQVEGRKSWRLYDTPIALPYRRQEFHPKDFTAGEVSAEFVLEAGDVLYIPRGLMHDARSLEDTSLHITLGLMHTSWTDLVAEALSQLGLRDVDFRRALPIGFARADFDRAEARAYFKHLATKLAALGDADAALDFFAEDFVGTRHARLAGQFEQLARVASLDLGATLTRRPEVVHRAYLDGEHAVLEVYGQVVRLPAVAWASLLWMLAQPGPFALAAVEGSLDDAGKLVLARKLIKEGVFTASL
ncbi:MAG: hypothetical protein JNK72_26105 [Myxococcales bacterium]|nr:hypothetical protein [Myxococcales bacterium]